MIGEASFYGLYVPRLMLLCGATIAVLWAARRLLARFGVYRWVWHPALFDAALFIVLLYAMSRLSGLLAPFLVTS